MESERKRERGGDRKADRANICKECQKDRETDEKEKRKNENSTVNTSGIAWKRSPKPIKAAERMTCNVK